MSVGQTIPGFGYVSGSGNGGTYATYYFQPNPGGGQGGAYGSNISTGLASASMFGGGGGAATAQDSGTNYSASASGGGQFGGGGGGAAVWDYYGSVTMSVQSGSGASGVVFMEYLG